MQQVNYWVYIGDDGRAYSATSCQPPHELCSGGRWFQTSIDIPELPCWVSGNPPHEGYWYRWQLSPATLKPVAHRRWWDGERWRPNSESTTYCLETYASYYWTGGLMPRKPPPSEPERTCELRWEPLPENGPEHGTWLWRDKLGLGHWTVGALEQAKQHAAMCGYRITNDPREVYCEPLASCDVNWRLWWDDGKYRELRFLGEADARAEATRRGWRILEVMPSTPEKTCEVRWNGSTGWQVRTPDGGLSCPWSREDALSLAAARGYRVTNNPLEVELYQVLKTDAWKDGGACQLRWCLVGGNKPVHWLMRDRQTSLEHARAICRERGWRLLHDSPKRDCTTCAYSGAARFEECTMCSSRFSHWHPAEKPQYTLRASCTDARLESCR